MTNDESTGLSETPDADVATMPFDEQMAVAQDTMRRRSAMLRELAK